MGRGVGGPIAAAAAGAAVAVLAAGCGGPAGRPQARPTTLERLASAAGCDPAIQANAADLREGTCLTARGSYVLATFRTTAGMRTWLADARGYSGAYLVGARWVVGGPRGALRPVQERLGGSVEQAGQPGG